MDTKSLVLSSLIKNTDLWVTGEELATSLGLSRTAIWKAVSALRVEGYNIKAANKRGYSLISDNDILSAEGILPFLNDKSISQFISIFKTVNSTNDIAKQLIAEGKTDKIIVFSEEQVAGRGRKGRGFYSPFGVGIYMSIILHPKINIAEAITVTAAAAVAVCNALEEVLEIKPQIKWVNDIFYNGKKVCGILTEASCDLESGSVDYIIVGIGINFSTKEFPLDIKDTAGSVCKDNMVGVTRNKLAASIVNKILAHDYSSSEFSNTYKEKSMLIGKDVEIVENGNTYKGFAEDIDEKCGLIIKLNSGEYRTLRSGDITVRYVA